MESIIETAKTFGGVEHRLEFVAEKHGVTYINGSIDSSPTRTAAALSAIPERSIVLICGGYDKHIPFAPLAEAVLRHPGVAAEIRLCGKWTGNARITPCRQTEMGIADHGKPK